MITGKTILKVSDAFEGLTEKQLADSMALFAKTQPVILQFIQTTTLHATLMIQEFTLFNAYFVFTAYEAEHPDNAITLKREDIDTALRQVESWIDRFNTGTMDSESETQPYWLLYINDQLEGPFGDGSPRSDDERSLVLLVLKTILIAFEHAEKRLPPNPDQSSAHSNSIH